MVRDVAEFSEVEMLKGLMRADLARMLMIWWLVMRLLLVSMLLHANDFD